MVPLYKALLAQLHSLSHDTVNSIYVVLYFVRSHGKQKSIKGATANRYDIWCQVKKNHYKDIGDYQPGIDGDYQPEWKYFTSTAR